MKRERSDGDFTGDKKSFGQKVKNQVDFHLFIFFKVCKRHFLVIKLWHRNSDKPLHPKTDDPSVVLFLVFILRPKQTLSEK